MNLFGRNCSFWWWIWLLFAVSGCHSIPRPAWVAGVRIQKSNPVVVLERDPTGGRMYPVVWRSADGAVWMTSGGGTRVSRDGGVSWGMAVDGVPVRGLTGMTDDLALVVDDGIAKYSGDDIVYTGQRLHQELIVESNMVVQVKGVPALASVASRGAREDFAPHLFAPRNRGIRLTDGTLLLTAYTRFEGDRLARCILLASQDQGSTFSYRSTIATRADASWSTEGLSEAALVLLPGGELLCIMRTGCDANYHALKMLEARSSDGGYTWGDRRMMAVRGVNPVAVQLENGILACTSSRPGNQIVFSTDGGRTWTMDVQVNATDTPSSAYMDMTAIDSNKLLVVYEELNTYTSKLWLWEPPVKKDRVLGMVIQVDAARNASP